MRADISRAVTGLALAILLCGCASAKPPPPDPNWTCTLKHPGKHFDSLKQLPSEIRTALMAKAGAMADRGEFFNAGDVVSKPAPFNRFIRGGEYSEYVFVWYEHGGFAYWHEIVIYGRELAAHVVIDQHAIDRDLCAETDRLLDGLVTPH